MKLRLQPWQLAASVIVACVLAVWIARWGRLSRNYDAPMLFSALPADQATLLYLDIGKLRDTGILDVIAGARSLEEAEYRQFIEQTGFDYRRDLDAVAIAFRGNNVYMTLRGRFQWNQLETFARSESGECRYTICWMPPNRQGRRVSFYPIRPNVLAFAVSEDDHGVNTISPGQWTGARNLPADPIWVRLDAASIGQNPVIPDGLKAYLQPLARSEHVTLALNSSGNGFQLRLEAACENSDTAAAVKRDLSVATDTIRDMMRTTEVDNPGSLGRILMSGVVEQNGTQVVETWPLEARFLETLTGPN